MVKHKIVYIKAQARQEGRMLEIRRIAPLGRP
jgi:hypothetical protein